MGDLSIQPIQDSNINDGLIDERLPQHPFFMSIIAPRGGGKTTFLLNLITKRSMYYKYFHKIYIFSPTQYSDSKMMNAIDLDEEQRFMQYDDSILRELMQEQLENNTEVKPKNRRRLLFIFDDLIEQLPRTTGNAFNMLAANGRHYYASVIVTSQYLKKLSPIIRVNTKHWIIFDVANKKEMLNLYEEIGGKLSKEAFDDLIEYATSGRHDFMYVNFDAPKNERYRHFFTQVIKIS
jgi:hypothetical protein